MKSSTVSLLGVLIGVPAGLGMAALGVFILTLLPEAWKELNDKWTEAPGTIVAVGVKSRQVRTGNDPTNYHYSTNNTVVLDCAYGVDGKDFTARELVAPEQAPYQGADPEAVQRVAEGYRIGSAIPVFFNPADPAKARLEANAPNGFFVMCALFGPMSILAGAGLAWWAWADWRRKRGTA